mgnify:CR=1 FL=1
MHITELLGISKIPYHTTGAENQVCFTLLPDSSYISNVCISYVRNGYIKLNLPFHCQLINFLKKKTPHIYIYIIINASYLGICEV